MTSKSAGQCPKAATLAVFLVATVVALPVAQAGSIYRCESNGVVEYSNAPPAGKSGQACRKIDLPAITTIPAPPPQPKSAAKAKAKSTAKANGAQRVRDQERARILRDELRREEDRLSQLKEEYKGGEPDRRGDERNYQKYLTRVDGLKQGIARGEANISALQRELADLK